MTDAPELRAALADAVAVAVRELAGVVAHPSAPEPRSDDPLAMALPVQTAAGDGFIALVAPGPVAAALARAVLGDACPNPDPPLVLDSLGEVLNVVAGQAKTCLRESPIHFTLGTPGPVAAESVASEFRLSFTCPFGPFDLTVRLPA